VPEALNQFAQRYAIYAIRGTWLAIYSSVNGWQTKRLSGGKPPASGSVWAEEGLRG